MYNINELKLVNHRNLQLLAKPMGIPLNVKRQYLIDMIILYQENRHSELKDLVIRIKRERQIKLKATKKKRELNSLMDSPTPEKVPEYSLRQPPIQRSGRLRPTRLVFDEPYCNPDREIKMSLQKLLNKDNGKRTLSTRMSAVQGGREVFKNNVCRVVNINNMCVVNNVTNHVKCETTQSGPKVKVIRTINNNFIKRSLLSSQSKPSEVLKPKPINSLVIQPRPFIVHRPVNILKKNGTVTSILGLLQKNRSENHTPIPAIKNKETKTYPAQKNKENLTLKFANKNTNTDNDFTNYYHKKIRADVRRESVEYRGTIIDDNNNLPHINEVFSKFNGHKSSPDQPVYSVNCDLNKNSNIPNSNLYSSNSLPQESSPPLERLYNINVKTSQSNPMTRTNITTTVYTTAIFSSIASFNPAHSYYNWQTAEDRRQYVHQMNAYVDSPLEVLASQAQTIDNQSQCTASDLDDALDIISQDGDYMERIGMDTPMSCVLCVWIGPKMMLEHHIKREHQSQIRRMCKEECKLIFSLGSLINSCTWLTELFELDTELYVLRAKIYEPDCFIAVLNAIPTSPDVSEPKRGRITSYNLVTSDPYYWEGLIPLLPTNHLYTFGEEFLKLNISELNWLPYGSESVLCNGLLVARANPNIIIAQPKLDEIFIDLSVCIGF